MLKRSVSCRQKVVPIIKDLDIKRTNPIKISNRLIPKVKNSYFQSETRNFVISNTNVKYLDNTQSFAKTFTENCNNAYVFGLPLLFVKYRGCFSKILLLLKESF